MQLILIHEKAKKINTQVMFITVAHSDKQCHGRKCD